MLEIYGEFVFATTKYQNKGQPWGPPTGQRRPPAAAWGSPAGGARPCPWGSSSAPSDAYKLPFTLKRRGGDYFPETRPRRAVTENPSLEVQSEADPGTLPEGRSIPEGSALTCLPPG